VCQICQDFAIAWIPSAFLARLERIFDTQAATTINGGAYVTSRSGDR
jgi:hypothetical protein